jgi:hypothetical protein
MKPAAFVAAAACAIVVNVDAGIAAIGGPTLPRSDAMAMGESSRSDIRRVDMTPHERIACEAIVCLSLIGKPETSCKRSLVKFASLSTQQRVPFLALCPHAKWFDLHDVVQGSRPQDQRQGRGL